MRRAILFIAMVAGFAPTVVAQEIPRPEGDYADTWSEPNPGLRYLHRTSVDPPLSLHVIEADLTVEGVSVVATPESQRWSTVSEFALRREAAAAVNGGFWDLMQRPLGVAVGDGQSWSRGEPDEGSGYFAVLRSGRAVIRPPVTGEPERVLRGLRAAVSGHPRLVRDGDLDLQSLDDFEGSNYRQPRTAVGVGSNGRKVFLVVVDGRQSHSRGQTLYQLARLLVALGAEDALNLDGGGSSAMFIERAGGIVNSPARGRWATALGLSEDSQGRHRLHRGVRQRFVRGVEREVINHIALLAAAHSVETISGPALLDGLADREPVPREHRREPPARVQPFHGREWLAPLSLLLFALLAAWALITSLRRWRKARLSSAR